MGQKGDDTPQKMIDAKKRALQKQAMEETIPSPDDAKMREAPKSDREDLARGREIKGKDVKSSMPTKPPKRSKYPSQTLTEEQKKEQKKKMKPLKSK